MITIYCKGIKKAFIDGGNKIQVLRGVDLEISDKKLTLLVGPSGSGKTTLLSIIETILTPDAGELLILGYPVNKMSELEKAHFRNQHLGVVYEAFHLIPTLTVLENVTLPLIIRGEHEKNANKRGLSLLEQLNIPEKKIFPPHCYPVGNNKGLRLHVP